MKTEQEHYAEKIRDFINDITDDNEISECCGASVVMGLCSQCREHV